MPKPRILVVGSSNTDMIIKLDRIPQPGETILGGELVIAAGGKGANQAVAVARAGGDVTFIARVGEDLFGEKAVDGFVQDGIQTGYIIRDKTAPSGVAMIFVAKGGENCIAVASGDNGKITPADVKRARPAFTKASALVMQLETPLETIQTAAALAAKAGVPVILNPAPARALPDKLLELVSILTPNETEAKLLTGITVKDDNSAARAAKKLRAKGIAIVIITLGSRGAFVATDSVSQRVPSFPVTAVDTTAAGDVFNGALAVGLGEGVSLLEAVRFANAAAAISVTRLGAQPSAPRRKEIQALCARNDA